MISTMLAIFVNVFLILILLGALYEIFVVSFLFILIVIQNFYVLINNEEKSKNTKEFRHRVAGISLINMFINFLNS